VSMRVLLLFGGRSAERDISLESASYVRSVLMGYPVPHTVVDVEIGASGEWTSGGVPLTFRAGKGRWDLLSDGSPIGFDLVFPVLHGPWGEDGTVQGLCAMAGWPCAGAGVLGSALAMNKDACKRFLQGAGFRMVPWRTVSSVPGPAESGRLAGELGLPCFVKPARLGSSVGITRVDSADGIPAAVELALGYDPLVIVETGVRSPREVEVSVLGDSGGTEVSIPGEIRPGRDWYDYEAKYDCGDSRLLIPAPLPRDLSEAVRETAGRAFRLVVERGYARVDFLLSGEGELYLNELNTIPGFTRISMFPKLWEAGGTPIETVIGRIMSEALGRDATGLAPGGGE
jgi:D-alanine-D-alanine ligase